MRHRVPVIGCMIAALGLGCTTARRLSVLQMPDPSVTSEKAVDVAPYLSLAGIYDGVYLNYEIVIEHSGIKEDPGLFSSGKDWEYSQIGRRKYIVLNPEAQWLTTFSIGWKPDRLYMRITSPRGQVRTYGLSDLQEIKLGKYRSEYKFAFPNVEKGSVIDIGFESNYAVQYFPPPLDHDLPVQFSIPCEHLSIRFSCPNWWDIQVKDNTPGEKRPVEFAQDSANHKTTMSYAIDSVAAYTVERFSPPIAVIAPPLSFRVTSVKMRGYDLEIPETWEDMIDQLFKYALRSMDENEDFTRDARHRSKGRERLDRVADSICRGAASTRDSIEAVTRFVSSTIKVGYEGNQGNPEKTLTAKEGNPFDLCSLAMYLLHALGYKTDLILVHDADDGTLDKLFVSPDQYAAPALRVQAGGATYTLFPYYKNLPAGTVPPMFQGQPALVLGDRTIGGPWTVPYDSTSVDLTTHTVEAVVDSLGQLHCSSRVIMKGGTAYVVGRELEEIPAAEIKDSVQRWIVPKGITATLDSAHVINDTILQRPLELLAYYTVPDAVTISPDENLVRVAELLSPIWDYRIDADAGARVNDVEIDVDERYEHRLVLTVPQGWVLTSSVPDQQIDNMFGALKRTSIVDGDSVVITRILAMRHGRAPKDKISDLLSLVGSRASAEVSSLVFQRRLP